MRQWMVNPKYMCRKHLLGEHVEHHMFIGTLLKKISIKGYIKNDLLEPLSLQQRHDQIVEEMLLRGYSHNTPLNFNISLLEYLSNEYIYHKIDRQNSERLLFSRCEECKKRWLMSINSLEIMFNDLTREAQEKVLKFYNIESVEDTNSDIVPLFILEKEDSGQ